MTKFNDENEPRMGPIAQAMCTLLGAASGALACYLAFQLFTEFNWAILGAALGSLLFAIEFFRGASSGRYPAWVEAMLSMP